MNHATTTCQRDCIKGVSGMYVIIKLRGAFTLKMIVEKNMILARLTNESTLYDIQGYIGWCHICNVNCDIYHKRIRAYLTTDQPNEVLRRHNVRICNICASKLERLYNYYENPNWISMGIGDPVKYAMHEYTALMDECYYYGFNGMYMPIIRDIRTIIMRIYVELFIQ